MSNNKKNNNKRQVNRKNNNQQEVQNTNKSTEIVVTVLAIAILIVAVVGISFAAFTYTKAGTKENSVTTGTITMNYTEGEKGINITDAYPISDDIGKAFTADNLNDDSGRAGTIGADGAGVFDFNVSASIGGTATINYDIIAVKQEASDLGDEYAKLYLEKTTVEEGASGYTAVDEATGADGVAVYNELDDASTGATTTAGQAASGKVLHTDSFNSATIADAPTHYYRLRMWVSDKYGDTDTEGQSFADTHTFSIKVDVYGQGA